MHPSSSLHLDIGARGRVLLRGATSWWYMVYFGAIVLVMALSPSSYNGASRVTTSKYIYAST